MSNLLSEYWLQIVGDERYNVETRCIIGNRKIAGLVDEYAQSRIFVHAYKARAAGCPPLKAKNFLRVSVTPAFRLSSPCMISNLLSVRKGADFGKILKNWGGTPGAVVIWSGNGVILQDNVKEVKRHEEDFAEVAAVSAER